MYVPWRLFGKGEGIGRDSITLPWIAASTLKLVFMRIKLLPSPANATYPLYGWVNWMNVSKIPYSRKQ